MGRFPTGLIGGLNTTNLRRAVLKGRIVPSVCQKHAKTRVFASSAMPHASVASIASPSLQKNDGHPCSDLYAARSSSSTTAWRILSMISTSNGQRSTHTPHSTQAEALTGKPRVPLLDLLDPPGRNLIEVPDHPANFNILRTRKTVLVLRSTIHTAHSRSPAGLYSATSLCTRANRTPPNASRSALVCLLLAHSPKGPPSAAPPPNAELLR